MDNDLVLASLNKEQIFRAKEENGKRRQITHALVVGAHGTMFGTEKQCRKYYFVWSDIFKELFGKCYETDQYQVNCYVDSGNVVMSLIEESDGKKAKIVQHQSTQQSKPKNKGLFARLFGS